MKSKGLGDDIEKVMEATGIKTLVHKVFGEDCGCEERKQMLNKIFPYPTECLTETEYNYLLGFNFNINSLTPVDQQELLKMYNRVFNQHNPPTSCTACWQKIISELNTLFNEYKK